MKKLYKVELRFEEWIEVIIAVNLLQYSTKNYERNEELAREQKEIVNKIQKQITQNYISITEKKSRQL